MRFCVLAALGALALAGCKTETGAKESASAQPSGAPAPAPSAWAKDPGKRLEPGDEVPDFSAISHTGYRVDRASLGERPAVLFFCPAITAPPCDQETLAIRDQWVELAPEVGRVFGISTQDNVAHRDFASEHDLPFLLLSDAGGQMKKAFGVGRKDASERVTFLVGADKEITRVFVNPDPKGHGRELVEALGK